MELLAVQRYWPAYVNWTFFSVRDETRAWLRTTMFRSRLCNKEEVAITLISREILNVLRLLSETL